MLGRKASPAVPVIVVLALLFIPPVHLGLSLFCRGTRVSTPNLVPEVLNTAAVHQGVMETNKRYGTGGAIEKFAVYYGPGIPGWLEGYDLVIVSPLLSEQEVREAKERNNIIVGYMSIASIGGWEPWANAVKDDMIIGGRSEWNEFWVNACSAAWIDTLLNASDWIISKGFDGVFLDNLDVVDAYPWMSECIVEIVKALRSRHPDMFIVVNRGFTIIDEIGDYIDAVLFEDLGTYYDPSTGTYKVFSGPDLRWIEEQASRLARLSEKHGFTVLALAYADPDDPDSAYKECSLAVSLAEKYGFPLYVSNGMLTGPVECFNQSSNNMQVEVPRRSGGTRGFPVPLLLSIVTAISLAIIIMVVMKSTRKNLEG